MLIPYNYQFLIKKLKSILHRRSLRGALEGVGEVIINKVLLIIGFEELLCCIGEFGLLLSQFLHKSFGGFSLFYEMHALVGILLHHIAQVLLHQRLLIEGLLVFPASVALPNALHCQVAGPGAFHQFGIIRLEFAGLMAYLIGDQGSTLWHQ